MSSENIWFGVLGSSPPSRLRGAKFRGRVMEMCGLRCAGENAREGEGARSAMVMSERASQTENTSQQCPRRFEGAETRKMQA